MKEKKRSFFPHIHTQREYGTFVQSKGKFI